jgi:hypothetical protein
MFSVGAVREPPAYRDIEDRTDMITQQQDIVRAEREDGSDTETETAAVGEQE